MSTAMGLIFWIGEICNYWAPQSIDFWFSIEELSSRLNAEARVSSGFGGYWERILARLKNFDFLGTIGGTQKSG